MSGVEGERNDAGIIAMPLLGITFLIILVFTTLTTLKKDPVRSKPFEAIVGVICPLMSIVGSFGMLFWVSALFLKDERAARLRVSAHRDSRPLLDPCHRSRRRLHLPARLAKKSARRS